MSSSLKLIKQNKWEKVQCAEVWTSKKCPIVLILSFIFIKFHAKVEADIKAWDFLLFKSKFIVIS